MNKRISIITINLNNAQGLEKTIESVIIQNSNLFEFIIIDGNSSDTSLEVIGKYKSNIDQFISESDNGIYHAMNKGVRLANGDYCLFLNSGDWLTSVGILDELCSPDYQADIIAGDVYYYDTTLNKIKWLVQSPERITAKYLFFGSLPHQSTLIRKSLFDRVGYYNEQLKIASDWLFFVEALLVFNCSYQHAEYVVAYFNMDGISCDPGSNFLPRREQLTILQEKYPLFLSDYEYFNELEEKTNKWLDSREYKVYRFLERTGFISFGVFCRRVKRSFQRNVLRMTLK